MVEVSLMCVSCDALVFGFPGCSVGRVSEFVRIPEVELDVDGTELVSADHKRADCRYVLHQATSRSPRFHMTGLGITVAAWHTPSRLR